jgi:dTDP-4-amino-4,6-dideoxygalactose transaminase
VAQPVLMNDPTAEFRLLQGELLPVVERVLASGRYVLAAEVERFEIAFAARVGSAHAVGVGSGTAALTLALRAAGLGPGDEVLTVPNTDSPTASAITATGADLGFVDVDPRTFCMDPAALEARVSSRTAAVVPVHLFGHAADLEPILAIARARDLLVIEDAALAVGATYDGRWVGGFGDIGCFSLAPSKILGAYGDAGVVATSDAEIARRLRVLRNYGHAEDMILDEQNLRGFAHWRVLEEGMNERLDELQAALLNAKLPTLETRIGARREHARRYGELLDGSTAEPPVEAPRVRHVYFAYTVLVDERERLRDHLSSRGIASRLYYNPPLHLQPAFERLGLGAGSFPVAEATAARMLALPVHPYLDEADVERVGAAVLEGAGTR